MQVGDSVAKGATLEETHVHKVYDEIAGHFSQTRYKPWPVIQDFLESLPRGSIVGDIGCGNGKYSAINKENLCYVGCDRSLGLLSHAKQLQPHADFTLCDGLRTPYKSECFDHVISIAVIHHFSTHERRVDAVLELLRVLKKGGRMLIFVWAFEQTATSKRKFDSQDVFVSWNKAGVEEVFYRYYHVFKEGELGALVRDALAKGNMEASTIIKTGYDRDNWYIEVQKT
ncbi:hypothetical protein MP638_003582 [Amoeboaphelidium occidentale]|nr:hypothetical protein MP638_003582 [Amoeboaphelidium occidentale]